MRMELGIALLLLFAGISAAQAPLPSACSASSITAFWGTRFSNWVTICSLGIVISFLVISIIYMLSQLFGRPQLAAWCKSELFQVLVTAIIFGSIFGFINFTCTVVKPTMFVWIDDNGDGIPDDIDIFQYSGHYLEWLRDRAYTAYYMTTTFNALVSYVASVWVNSSPGGFGVALRPLSGLNTISSMLTFVMNTLLMGAVLPTMAQLRMLHVILLMAFNILLPIGLMSRCFQPTRRFGGSLIAIAIGLYIVYPLLLVINAGIVQDKILFGMPSQGILSEAAFQSTGNEASKIFDPSDPLYFKDQTSPDATKTRYGYASDPAAYDPAGGPGFTEMSGYNNIFNKIYSWSLYITIATLFLPLLNFILLVTFILNLSRVLGEEVDVTSITRMI